MTVRALTACVLAVGALLAGCASTTAGRPQGSSARPGEPTVATPRPSRSVPTPATPSAPSAAAPPTAAETLPSENGYAFVATKSGKTRCQLSRDEVGCESAFTNAPSIDGVPANGVRVSADGHLQWLVGNLGDPPVVPLDYRTYAAQGWTIEASESGTRFTNDATKHGMVVAIDRVDVF